MDSVVRGYRVKRLAELLADEFRDRRSRADLATLVAERSHEEVERWVDELTLAQLGVQPSGAMFVKKGAGLVCAIVLENGEPAVLKLFSRSFSHAELSAIQRCSSIAGAHGYPVPRQRGEIFDSGEGVFGAFYSYVDGDRHDAHEPGVRRELSRSLADLNALLAPLDGSGLPTAPGRQDALWPAAQRIWEQRPDADDETRFIDEHARGAQLVLKKSKLTRVVTFLDWGVKNVRFRDERVCAVYDSDSVHTASEAESIGRAAAQFTAQWEQPTLLTPTSSEAKAFVEEYQAARGRKLSRTERAVAAAAARYAVAQMARLELLSGVPEADNYRGLLRNYDEQPLL